MLGVMDWAIVPLADVVGGAAAEEEFVGADVVVVVDIYDFVLLVFSKVPVAAYITLVSSFSPLA